MSVKYTGWLSQGAVISLRKPKGCREFTVCVLIYEGVLCHNTV